MQLFLEPVLKKLFTEPAPGVGEKSRNQCQAKIGTSSESATFPELALEETHSITSTRKSCTFIEDESMFAESVCLFNV